MSRFTLPRDPWVELDLPAVVHGRVGELAASAGWQVQHRGNAWRVCTRENYLKQRPNLLTLRPVDTPEIRPGTGYEILGTLMDQEHLVSHQTREMIAAELKRLEGINGNEVAGLLARFQLSFTNSPTSDLPAVMSRIFTAEARIKIPGSRLYLVDLAPQLGARYTLVRLLLTAYVAPAIGELPAGRAMATSGIFGAQALISPALLAQAPYLFGICAPRARATGVWLFGRPVAGMVWPSSELIDAAKPLDERFVGKRMRAAAIPPAITSEQLGVFLSWWVEQVNHVLRVATDPSLFRDKANDKYDPCRHMAYLASLERLFQDVHQVRFCAEQSETGRLRAAYDALDCLEGMRLGGFADLTTPSKVQKEFDHLKAILPAEAAVAVLPTCQGALDALNDIEDQFYPSPNRGADGLTAVPGRGLLVPWDRAIPDYLRIDRNSAHSFLKEIDPDREPDKLAIFLSHTGMMPNKLSDLAFFWLLANLAQPDRLEQRLTR